MKHKELWLSPKWLCGNSDIKYVMYVMYNELRPCI